MPNTLRKACLVGSFLGLTALSALAADPEEVKTPYVEAGDCWSYHGTNLYNRGFIEDYELCVTFVDPIKNMILATAKVKGEQREIDTAYTHEWGDITAIYGMIANPPARNLKFPMHVGDTYSIEYEYRGNYGAHNPGIHALNVEVVGWEDITVLAGKFRALKVVARGAMQPPGWTAEIAMMRTWWYVPEVERYVKFSMESRPNTFSEELTGYRLNK